MLVVKEKKNTSAAPVDEGALAGEEMVEETVLASADDDGGATTQDQAGSDPGIESETAAVEDGPETIIATLEKEKRDLQDKLLRMAAEQENFKKRMAKERSSALKFAEENILREILPTIDNLERALLQEQDVDGNSLIEGVDLTLKALLTTLKRYDLEPLESVGEPFDPNFHEALVMEASADIPAQHVISEFEKGYTFRGRLLRAAKVVVSKGQEEGEVGA